MRVLIVEDERKCVVNLLEQLEILGFTDVEVCSWGSEEGASGMPSAEYIGTRIQLADIILLDHELSSSEYDGEILFYRFCEGRKVISTSSCSRNYGNAHFRGKIGLHNHVRLGEFIKKVVDLR